MQGYKYILLLLLNLNIRTPAAKSFCNSPLQSSEFQDPEDSRNPRSLAYKQNIRSRAKKKWKWKSAYSRPVTWKLQTKNLPMSVEYFDGTSPYSELVDIFRTALNLWSKDVRINFRQVQPHQGAEIIISFERREHDCNLPFKGPGEAVAHAFPPGNRDFLSDKDGDLHIDIEEEWVWKRKMLDHMYKYDYRNWLEFTNGRMPNKRREANPKLRFDENGTEISGITSPEVPRSKPIKLMYTAIHEIGHSLGLYHKNSNRSIMYAYMEQSEFLREFDPEKPSIPRMDIDSLVALYGPRRPMKPSFPVRSPTSGRIPDNGASVGKAGFLTPSVITMMVIVGSVILAIVIVAIVLKVKYSSKDASYMRGEAEENVEETR